MFSPIGPRLKALRLQAGLTLHELASRAHMHIQHLARIENTGRDCRLETLRVLLDALGATFADLDEPVIQVEKGNDR